MQSLRSVRRVAELGALGRSTMRLLFLMLVLCGCATAPKTEWRVSQSEPRNDDYRIWRPTAGECSRAEAAARLYAVPALRLSETHVAKMKADFTGIHRSGNRQLLIQFYDPERFQPLPSCGFEPMLGGFPSYFTVTVDVQIWTVVDHYASKR